MQQRGGEIMNNPEYLEFEGREGLTSCKDSTEGTLTCGCSNLRTWKSVHVPDFFHTEGRKCSQERDKGSESPDDWSPPSLKNRPISDLKCAEADTRLHCLSACVLCVKPSVQWGGEEVSQGHELSLILCGMYRSFPHRNFGASSTSFDFIFDE